MGASRSRATCVLPFRLGRQPETVGSYVPAHPAIIDGVGGLQSVGRGQPVAQVDGFEPGHAAHRTVAPIPDQCAARDGECFKLYRTADVAAGVVKFYGPWGNVRHFADLVVHRRSYRSVVDAYRYGMQSATVWGMTTQIAVRLPDEMVRFLDDSVAAGVGSSRAAVVTGALEREIRRQAALKDARILAEAGAADDLDGLVAWSAQELPVED